MPPRAKTKTISAVVQRQPNGQLSRSKKTTAQNQNDKTRLNNDRMQETVLNQLHRRGNKSEKCGSFFGLVCLRDNIDNDYYEAGNRYLHAYRHWAVAVVNMPMPGHISCNGLGSILSYAKKRKIQDFYFGAENAIKQVHHRSFVTLRHIIIDNEACQNIDNFSDAESVILIRRGLEALYYYFKKQKAP